MRFLRTAVSALALSCPALSLRATDIVFIGNSYTHGNIPATINYNAAAITDLNGTGYGGIPGIFKKLATEGGYSDVNVHIEAISGQRLSQHLAEQTAKFARRWDIAVVQEYSTRTLTSYNDGNANLPLFQQNVQTLRDLFRQYNPNVAIFLYETWARPDLVPTAYPTLQTMQNEIRNAYSQAASNYGLTGWSPVGDAFMRAVDLGYAYDAKNSTPPNANSVNLWASDNQHASIYGAYLSAAVHYARILGGDARALPTGAGSAAAALGISATVADNLQQVAWDLVQASAVTLIAQPASQTVFVGSPVTFGVAAKGSSLTYQWRKNGVNISGATSSSFTIANAQAADAAAYSVVVTGSSGAVTSSSATLSLTSTAITNTFLIDLGDSALTTASPDATGKYWNNFSTSTPAGAQLTSLRTAANVVRPGVTVGIVTPFNGINSTGVNASTVYPASAQRDSFYINGGATAKAQVRLSGLHQNNKYTVKLFASRQGADATRTGRYTIAGLSPVFLNAADNTSATATLGPIQSAVSNLTLSVESYDAANVVQAYAYLGAIELTEQVPAVSNVHAGAWAARGVVSSTATWTNFYQQPTGVPTNTAYTGSFWLKGSGKVTLRVLVPGWSSTLVSQQYTATPTWTQCTLPTFNTGANTSLVYAFSDSGAVAGTFYIDDCFLGISGGTNKLANPGFESGATTWTSDGYMTILQNP